MIGDSVSQCFYTQPAAATALASFTTEANLMQGAGVGIPTIPGGFFLNPQAAGKVLHVYASGRLSSTATPTYTFSVRLLPSSTWSAGGIGFSTAALTTASGITNAFWELEARIILRSLGSATGADTIACIGKVWSGAGLASPFGYTIPATAGTITSTTFDRTVSQYLFTSVACSASSASNTIQQEMCTVTALN